MIFPPDQVSNEPGVTHSVHYLRYWVDEQHGKVFCLVDAPDAVAAHAVHRMAHGLIPGAIFAVREGR